MDALPGREIQEVQSETDDSLLRILNYQRARGWLRPEERGPQVRRCGLDLVSGLLVGSQVDDQLVHRVDIGISGFANGRVHQIILDHTRREPPPFRTDRRFRTGRGRPVAYVLRPRRPNGLARRPDADVLRPGRSNGLARRPDADVLRPGRPNGLARRPDPYVSRPGRPNGLALTTRSVRLAPKASKRPTATARCVRLRPGRPNGLARRPDPYVSRPRRQEWPARRPDADVWRPGRPNGLALNPPV